MDVDVLYSEAGSELRTRVGAMQVLGRETGGPLLLLLYLLLYDARHRKITTATGTFNSFNCFSVLVFRPSCQ